jgi:putative FmdB family regulatory protein
MPIYEYRCGNGHTFEVMQSFSDDPIAECQTCALPVEKVFHPVAVHFKGKGFYNTDYGTRKRAREKESESAGSSESKGSSEGKGSSESKSSSDGQGSSESKSSSGGSSGDSSSSSAGSGESGAKAKSKSAKAA